MIKILVPAAMVLSLAAGSAFAATSPAKSTPTAHAASTKTKTQACEKEWKAQKKHDVTRKAFMKECEAKA